MASAAAPGSSSAIVPGLAYFPTFLPTFRDLMGGVLGVPFPGDPSGFFHTWTRSARKIWLHRRYLHVRVEDFQFRMSGLKNLLETLGWCLRVALKEEIFAYLCHVFDSPLSTSYDPMPAWTERVLPSGMTPLEVRMLHRLAISFSTSSDTPYPYALEFIDFIVSNAIISSDPADPSNV
jgi:hypothetical protein